MQAKYYLKRLISLVIISLMLYFIIQKSRTSVTIPKQQQFVSITQKIDSVFKKQ